MSNLLGYNSDIRRAPFPTHAGARFQWLHKNAMHVDTCGPGPVDPNVTPLQYRRPYEHVTLAQLYAAVQRLSSGINFTNP